MTTLSPRANWQDIIEAHDEQESGNGAPQLTNRDLLMPADRFVKRHIGPRSHDVTHMPVSYTHLTLPTNREV